MTDILPIVNIFILIVGSSFVKNFLNIDTFWFSFFKLLLQISFYLFLIVRRTIPHIVIFFVTWLVHWYESCGNEFSGRVVVFWSFPINGHLVIVSLIRYRFVLLLLISSYFDGTRVPDGRVVVESFSRTTQSSVGLVSEVLVYSYVILRSS